MDAKIKQQWVDALRSGKYKQTRGWLRDESNAMCCLGVLCDLVDPEGWVYSDDPYESPEGWSHRDKNQMGLPTEIQKVVDLPASEPTIMYKGEFLSISLVNDNGATFAEIADLIEEQW